MPKDQDIRLERCAELEDFLENFVEGLHQAGPDGAILWANGAELAMLGYAREEYVGRNLADFHVEPRVARGFLERLARGEAIRGEPARMRCKDGSIRDVRVSSTAHFLNGEFAGSRSATRDVTHERGPRDAQARLAAIVECSDDAIVSKDVNGIVSSWNPAAERLLGYKAEEMIGQSILRIIPPELHHEEPEILRRIRGGERIEHLETVRMAKDGRRLPVSLSISPLRGPDGRVVGASKILRDVTQRQQADRERGMLAAIVESSDDAIISKDLQGIVTSWNPAAERLYGFTAREMLGQPILRIVPERLHMEEDQILDRLRAGERIDHYETMRQRKDGRLVEVSITVSPVLDAMGRIIGASKIARDVTPQREAQRRKDQFLAVLAHELRNPLAPIRNAVRLIKGGRLPPERVEQVLTIADRQMAQMTRLLDDLLDVARLTTGRIELHLGRVDLCTIAMDATEAVRPLAESRKIVFAAAIPEHPLWLNADGVRIAQIVQNLLTNACKYTDPGGKVELRVQQEENHAVVRVSDTGIGFTPEMHQRLFTLFSQDEKAARRSAGGLGIGLALVRDFTERHGGSVCARSAGPMKGSEFVVRLPLESEPVAQALTGVS